MKKLFLFLIFLSLTSKAQSPQEMLLGNVWELEIFDSECQSGPYNSTGNIPIYLEFTEENGAIYFSTEFCRQFSGTIENLTDETFEFQQTVVEGETCEDPIMNMFDGAYGCILGSGPYSYTIEIQDDSSMVLEMNNPVFMSARYVAVPMSTKDLKKDGILFYPNPVTEKLNIDNPNLDYDFIKVVNSDGKILLTNSIKSAKTELDLSFLNKGIYILIFEKDGKSIKSEKLIKR